MSNTNDIFEGATDIETRTKKLQQWMQKQSDDIKLHYVLNWRIPHTLFNVSCRYFKGKDIQNIDWFKIYREKKLGKWANGGKVCI